MAKTSKAINFDESTLVRMLNSMKGKTRVFDVSEGKIKFKTECFGFITSLEKLVKVYRPLLNLDLIDDPRERDRNSPFRFRVYALKTHIDSNKHKELGEKLYRLLSRYRYK